MRRLGRIGGLLLAFCLFAGCAGTQPAADAPVQAEAFAPTQTPAPAVALFEAVATAAPTPAPTPEPTAVPTPTPAPFAFFESAAMPLPSEAYPLHKGMACAIDGTVESAEPLTALTLTVTDRAGKVAFTHTQPFASEAQVRSCRLLDVLFSSEIECFSEQLSFQKLGTGSYALTLTAADAAGRSETLAARTFTVEDGSWRQLIPNMLRTNYAYALDFFGGDAERLLFRFRFTEGRRIALDPAWNEAYAAECIGLNGTKWACHRDAVPYFEQACRYLEGSYLYLHTDAGAVGPLPLARLAEMNGTMVRRFTGDGKFVSHHSFGTAVDLNAYTTSNKNRLENRSRIYQAVTEQLAYNGLVDHGGTLCYDYTFTGAFGEQKEGVPEVVVNYLLYELGFFRAGFGWGVYYPHTSDAMHFSLTELSPALFESGDFPMRKVFTYAEP